MVEHQIVILGAGGSSPLAHPKNLADAKFRISQLVRVPRETRSG